MDKNKITNSSKISEDVNSDKIQENQTSTVKIPKLEPAPKLEHQQTLVNEGQRNVIHKK